jgi:WD40 repeat protein
VFDNKLYVGSNDSKVFVFELAKGRGEEQELLTTSERSFYPHCTSVHFIVAAPAFLIVVPREEQQLIRIWNRETLQILHGYKGHAKQITAVIFLKDKQHIASSSYDATVRVWKISENFEFDLEIRKFAGKYPLLTLVELDGESVAFGGDDCFITVWNWTRDVVRHKCFAHPGSVISLSICPPNWLFSMGGDARIRAWRVEESERTSQNISEMCE